VQVTRTKKKGEFMHYDERYTEFIEMTGLLPFIHMVTRSMLPMNPSAITALVDRWRPETHTFHLRTGEMTVTLQDVAMILALPIEGQPLFFDTKSEGWREKMVGLIGRAPPEPVDKTKDRVPAGATYTWIVANFGTPPPNDADRDTIIQYARVYMWYVISRTLFADGGGRTAPWMWLQALTVFERKTSWGSVALAYLYRQVMCYVFT
jgi:hypothetical protein